MELLILGILLFGVIRTIDILNFRNEDANKGMVAEDTNPQNRPKAVVPSNDKCQVCIISLYLPGVN